jgi:hypothetical protein
VALRDEGSPVLCDPDASHLASTMVLLMQLKQVPFRVIAEFRMSAEPSISHMAAERISSEALAELAQTVSQMSGDLDNERSFLEANERFHVMDKVIHLDRLTADTTRAPLGVTRDALSADHHRSGQGTVDIRRYCARCDLRILFDS